MSMKSHVGQYNHLIFELPYEVLETSVMDIGCVTIPGSNKTQVVEHQTELSSYYPAVVGLALLAYLTRRPALPRRVDQFDSIAINDSHHGGRSQRKESVQA